MPGKKRKKKPAKRPPSKQRKAKRTPVQKKKKKNPPGRPTKASMEFEEGSRSYAAIRYSAGRYYVTDADKMCSLDDMARMPMFSMVSRSTLAHWSAEDGWVERRRQFIDNLNKKYASKLGTALVQARLSALKKTEAVAERLFDALISKAKHQILEANSLEGAANAYARLCVVLDDQREKLADAVMPEPIAVQQTENMLPTVRPRLSLEESRAAALTIVRMRREEMRAAMRQSDAEKQGEEGPPMRVIEGEK